jgi:hypothetical protein
VKRTRDSDDALSRPGVVRLRALRQMVRQRDCAGRRAVGAALAAVCCSVTAKTAAEAAPTAPPRREPVAGQQKILRLGADPTRTAPGFRTPRSPRLAASQAGPRFRVRKCWPLCPAPGTPGEGQGLGRGLSERHSRRTNPLPCPGLMKMPPKSAHLGSGAAGCHVARLGSPSPSPGTPNRVGVRVFEPVQRKTLTLSLSRSTGRGNQRAMESG